MCTAERPPTPPPARNSEPIVLRDVQRLVVNPGDILVVRTEHRLTQDQATRIRERIREATGLDDIRVICMDHELELAVLSGDGVTRTL